MRLEPRLIQKDKKLYVSFKTGAGRMFVVKNLEEFCEHVKMARRPFMARQQSSAIKGKILLKVLSMAGVCEQDRSGGGALCGPDGGFLAVFRKQTLCGNAPGAVWLAAGPVL